MDFSEEMADEILKIFQVESDEIISKMNNGLFILQKKPTDKDAIMTLFRDAHTLKGASRMVGFNNVQTLAHKIEDILGLAKDNKILLNSKVVEILYQTVDLLSDLIQTSIASGQETFNSKVSEHLALLENIEDIVEEPIFNDDQSDFDAILLAQNIEEINKLIPKCLYALREIEVDKDTNNINFFLNFSKKLYSIFESIGPFEIKNWLEDINVKLEFITKASNSLNHLEIEEIHQKLDCIIDKLISICSLYNIKTEDYYSAVFETSINIEPIKTEFESTSNEETKTTFPKSKLENKVLNPTEKIKEKTPNLLFIKDSINKLSHSDNSIFETIEKLRAYEKDCKNTDLLNILHKIISLLEYISNNKTIITEDVKTSISQSLEHCDNIIQNKLENADSELIIQQLEIIQQVLELEKEDDFSENKFLAKNKIKIKTYKSPELQDIFNNNEIKTMRVDSAKLDSLVNQVNELMVTKIKTQKHLHELNNINNDLEDWQKKLLKSLNYLKYYDKKYAQSFGSDNPISFFIKQLLNIFNDNNKIIQERINDLGNLHHSIQEDDAKLGLIIDNIEEKVKDVRVLPFSTVFHLFGKMIRDIAAEKNKKIELEIIGSETTTDKKIIEEIKAPLIHILRNSIDHGIESPEQRIAMGKNPVGKIILSARQAENKVIVEIIDDGSGINIEKIKEKALQKGFLTQEELNSMTNEQITNIIFAPGFSTGDSITNISGRGIGLDVVQTKIAQLNGKVKVISELNKGCCVQIELPTAMSNLMAFLVKASNQTFAIPMDVISFVLRKKSEEIIQDKGKKSILYNNKNLPIYDLSDILNLRKTETEKEKETILIIENDDKIMALAVDKLIDSQEILQKKLSAPFYKLKNIAGITSLVSGEICLILNISDIINKTTPEKICKVSEQTEKFLPNNTYKILIVDDSITTRTLAKNILSKIGYAIDTAQNPIEAFQKLNTSKFDLILTDLEMPEMDGLKFVEQLKTDEKYGDIPIVIISSVIKEESQKRAMELGVKKYFVKSDFSQELFQKTVDEILHKNLN